MLNSAREFRKLNELYLLQREEQARRANRALQSRPGGLIEFVRYFWDVLEPGRELIEGWALEAICLHLEAVTLGKINRLLINVSPGFMKSLLTNVFWPAWEWSAMGMDSHRFVTFSYAAHLTERDNGKFRDLLTSPKFKALWGDKFKLTEEGKVRVSNNKTGWKFASSVSGVSTGERGDRVILDDPHSVKESESETVRDETTRWFRESMSNRLNSLSESAIVVIMQRVHEIDVSGVILEEYPEYEFLCVPMEYDPSRAHETCIGWNDPRKEVGDLAWPERFSEIDLEPFKRNAFAWASQYQQTPKARGGNLLDADWWQLWDAEEAVKQGSLPGKYPPFEYVIATVDGAFTEKTENDPSAMTVWGIWVDRLDIKRIMLIYAWAERLQFKGLVDKVAATAKKYKIDRLLIENKASGISVAQEIRRLYATEEWVVHTVDPRGLDKVQRVNSISHFFEVGLVFAPNIKWAQMVIDQCASFPKGKNDDLVDCVSMAIKHFRDNGLAVLPTEREYYIEQSMMHRKARDAPLYPV